jgi:hypothetical protein
VYAAIGVIADVVCRVVLARSKKSSVKFTDVYTCSVG